MIFFKGRLFNIILLLLLIYTLLALNHFSLPARAQEPSPFQISLVPQNKYAVVGQPFTYTLVITNVSQTPLKDVVVRAETPPGTTFVDTTYTNVNWSVRKLGRGEVGEIFWITQEPVPPGEVIVFEMIVDVPPEFDQALINNGYRVAVSSIDNLVAAGPSIRTQVATVTPTPTLTPTPLPLSTVTGAPIGSTPTRLAAQTDVSATNGPPTATQATQTSFVADSVTPVPKAISQNKVWESFSLSTIGFVITGLAVIIVVIIGLIRSLRPK